MELIPPPGITAERVAEGLGALGTVRVEAARRVRRTLLDRADGTLRARGVTLEWQATPEGHRLAWRDGPRSPISLPLDPPAPRRAAALPQGLLRRRLLESAGHGDLIEVTSVQGQSHCVRLVDGEAKTVCRVSVERGAAVDPSRKRPLPLRKRVRVIPVKGHEALAARIASHLSEQPGWQASPEPLFDEAVRRLGRDAEARLRKRIADHLGSMERHRKAIDPAGDPEELHDFRVCLRRARTLLAQIGLFAASPAIAGELRWLGRVSGEARDLDVQAEDLRRTLRERCSHHHAAHPWIEARTEDLRLEAHRKLGDALGSKRYARLLRAAQAELRREIPRRKEPNPSEACARAPLHAGKLYRKALRQGRGLDPRTPDERFHRLRKTLKKLRYVLEARPARGEPGLKSLKGMQTILGELNDASVQRGLLEGLKSGLGADSKAPGEALRCIDTLLDHGEERRRALKTDFVRHFEDLGASGTRRNLLGPDSGTGASQ